jgi:hypothetical protein
LNPINIHIRELDWCLEKYNIFRSKVEAGHLKDEVLFDPEMLVFDCAINLYSRISELGGTSKYLVEHLSILVQLPKFRRVDMRMGRLSFHPFIPDGMNITREDVGKFFIISDDGKATKIVTAKEMGNMEPDEIDVWYGIGEFDVDDIRKALS